MSPTDLDFDACYAAVSGRDRRFDGRFVLAVHSTGIYCRPSCPARTPKPAHCVFFPTSAAAHLAGFRACKRCLPEAIPGNPDWNVREDIAARAMRLVADGVVDREGVPGLAARLGYSPRQLSRILTDELGAGPLALARAQRAHTARQLLVSTQMPASDVAFAAGFASIRQFNDTVAEVFGLTPTGLRDRARRAERPEAVAPGTVTVRLPARTPFDGAGVTAWLARRAIAGVEAVDGEAYTRSLRLEHGLAVTTLHAGGDHLSVTARVEHLADLPTLLARARRLYDLDADAEAVDRALARDARLAPAVAANPGIRIPGAVDPVEMLARAILGQQVSVAAARTAAQRLVDALGEPLPASLATGSVTRLFPTAATLAAHGRDALGGPAGRREALALATGRLASGEMSIDIGHTLAEVTASLEAIPGIGPWTSNYVALRVLGHPDLLLTGDSAVRAGAAVLGLPSDIRGLADAAAAFAPWRSYLMTHLWRAASPSQQSPSDLGEP